MKKTMKGFRLPASSSAFWHQWFRTLKWKSVRIKCPFYLELFSTVKSLGFKSNAWGNVGGCSL